MDNPRTDQPAPHAGEKEKPAGLGENPATQGPTAGTTSVASKTRSSATGRQTTIEPEGQVKPQERGLDPDDLERDGFPKPHP